MDDIRFRVDGLPPKKDGAISMWGKSAEIPRLVQLRRAALAAMAEGRPFAEGISLGLVIHVGPVNDQRTGDLDNFVTGVCDGLMAAHPGVPWKTNEVWTLAENDAVRPDRTIAIEDDSQVLSISAEKVVGDTQAPWYEATLSGQ